MWVSRPLVNLANNAAIVSDTISLNGGYTGLECNLQEKYIFAGIRSQVCGNQRQTNGHTCKLPVCKLPVSTTDHSSNSQHIKGTGNNLITRSAMGTPHCGTTISQGYHISYTTYTSQLPLPLTWICQFSWDERTSLPLTQTPSPCTDRSCPRKKKGREGGESTYMYMYVYNTLIHSHIIVQLYSVVFRRGG